MYNYVNQVNIFAALRKGRPCYNWLNNCDVTGEVSQGRGVTDGYCYSWQVRKSQYLRGLCHKDVAILCLTIHVQIL